MYKSIVYIEIYSLFYTVDAFEQMYSDLYPEL